MRTLSLDALRLSPHLFRKTSLGFDVFDGIGHQRPPSPRNPVLFAVQIEKQADARDFVLVLRITLEVLTGCPREAFGSFLRKWSARSETKRGTYDFL
jgi:hypothetical protein